MHVAIIPDGNRRWAKAKGLAATQGYSEAIKGDRMQQFLQEGKKLGLDCVSLWVFSTENWKRPEAEKKVLFGLFSERISELATVAQEEHVRIRWLGRRDRIAGELKSALERVEEETKDNDSLTFCLVLDYGGRDEIVRAVNKAVSAGEAVTEDSFNELLDTQDLPDPDLIIRTSGEHRLSGLFPWQGTYAELCFVEKHFPDFGPEDLAEAVNDFHDRQRRFGK